MNKNIQLQNKLVMLAEQVPLFVFVAIINLGYGMEERIITGGVLSLPVLSFIIVKKSIVSSTFLGANIFLLVCMLILLSPAYQLSQVLLNLGEPVMIIVIVLCSLVIAGVKISNYLLEYNKSKTFVITMIVTMLVTYLVCMFISFSFRGNEIIAGAIPVILLLVAEKIFSYSLEHNRIEVSNARS